MKTFPNYEPLDTFHDSNLISEEMLATWEKVLTLLSFQLLLKLSVTKFDSPGDLMLVELLPRLTSDMIKLYGLESDYLALSKLIRNLWMHKLLIEGFRAFEIVLRSWIKVIFKGFNLDIDLKCYESFWPFQWVNAITTRVSNLSGNTQLPFASFHEFVSTSQTTIT